MFPIRRAKRISPRIARAIEKMTSPGKVLVWSPWPRVLLHGHNEGSIKLTNFTAPIIEDIILRQICACPLISVILISVTVLMCNYYHLR